MLQDTDTLARELQRQYLKEWRAKNPDKVRGYNAAYWKRKAEQKAMESEQAEGKNDRETDRIC